MSNHNFIKGVGIGTAVGLTVGMIISPRDNHPGGKSGAGRAIRAFANIVDTIANTITA
jgi:gas vesicle protein